MLVELGLVEQRFAAVMEVINDGQPVTDVARRCGVSHQTVHRWLRRYTSGGVAGLVDGSPKPDTCPHQMLPVVEAMIVELRLDNPGWGPRTLLFKPRLDRHIRLAHDRVHPRATGRCSRRKRHRRCLGLGLPRNRHDTAR